jgi:hypothetical protein
MPEPRGTNQTLLVVVEQDLMMDSLRGTQLDRSVENTLRPTAQGNGLLLTQSLKSER